MLAKSLPNLEGMGRKEAQKVVMEAIEEFGEAKTMKMTRKKWSEVIIKLGEDSTAAQRLKQFREKLYRELQEPDMLGKKRYKRRGSGPGGQRKKGDQRYGSKRAGG